MLKKRVLLMMSLVLMLMMTAACSSSNSNAGSATDSESTNSQGEGEQKSGTDYASEKADLTVYGIDSPAAFEQNYGRYLKEKFPKYNITYIGETPEQKLDQLIVSGSPLDLYFGRANNLKSEYIPKALATDLTDLVKKHEVDLSRFDPVYLNDVTVDNSLYMLPIYDNRFVMYYNKDLFDRFGVEYPTDGMTWDDALALSKKMTRNEGGKQYVGLWTSPKHFVRQNQLSLDFVDPKTNEVSIDNDGWKELYQTIFYNFTRDPGVQARATEKWFGYADFNTDFAISMFVYQDIWMNSPDQSLPMNWDIVSVPTFKDHPKVGMQSYAMNVGISNTSKYKDAAMEVLKYLTSDEFQTILSKKGMITTLKSEEVKKQVYADSPTVSEKNLGAIFYNEVAPSHNFSNYDEIVTKAIERYSAEIAKGVVDVNTALRGTEDKAHELLQTEQSKQ